MSRIANEFAAPEIEFASPHPISISSNIESSLVAMKLDNPNFTSGMPEIGGGDINSGLVYSKKERSRTDFGGISPTQAPIRLISVSGSPLVHGIRTNPGFD